ncbi:MAG: membrane protease YdiL (CAAX protease family) [Flavobacteriales bacterium]
MEEEQQKQKSLILLLAGATIIVMPLIAMLIDWYSDSVDMSARLLKGAPWFAQIGLGLVMGVGFGAMAQFIVERKFMQSVNLKYTEMISDLRLTTSEIVFVSLCAGIGEEVLFRGAVQPLLGVIITAIIFVAIHGYLNPKDWKVSLYGVFMTGVIIVLGYTTEKVGIWSAIVAHTVIDIYLLRRMKFES